MEGGETMSGKRMGGLGKLSDFGRSTPTTPATSAKEAGSPQPKSETDSSPPKSKEPKKKAEKPVTINIKIGRDQQEWLAETARQVRDNNTDPVPAADRCYPQHLIQVAIDLLASSSVDWSEIRTPEDLRKQLNI